MGKTVHIKNKNKKKKKNSRYMYPLNLYNIFVAQKFVWNEILFSSILTLYLQNLQFCEIFSTTTISFIKGSLI